MKICYLAQPTIGLNQSGMKTQIDTLFEYFKNTDKIEVDKYNIWKNNKPDIIHYFGMGEGMLTLLQKLKENGSKIICSPNHWPIKSSFDKILMSINIKNVIYSNRVTKKYLLENADLFIVNSEAEKIKFIETYRVSSDRIKVIHNSYGSEPYLINKNLFREKYSIQKPYALMAGQFGSVRKNQLPVLQCWKESYPDLYILGGYDKTPYGKKCFKYIEDKNNIHYLGFESEYDILESAYQQCELFISPGLIETPSLSAFRALINGAKVCSTNFGGAPNEYFSDNVRYFDPYNKNEIASTIDASLKSEKWMIDFEGLKKFSNYSINQEYKKIYLNLF
ncbi:MAG: hypothetical protein CMC13_00065 [Flavobacteriaceae bacterium]|nr:hypothetical protein [Flavobacteriaceae bacterium]|tara:strand:+ start:3786 stop:4790 length:1005 start_codon:yes stop_codon:yes gene_type:complete